MGGGIARAAVAGRQSPIPSPFRRKLARFPLLNARLSTIMEGVRTEPKTRRATRNGPAAGKARGPKRPAAKRRKTPRPQPVPQPGPDVPYWISRDSGRAALSKMARQAVTQILAPAYRQLVLEAQGEVGHCVGITLVHLMWLDPLADSPGWGGGGREISENRKSADQHAHPALALLAVRPDLFARQGSGRGLVAPPRDADLWALLSAEVSSPGHQRLECRLGHGE